TLFLPILFYSIVYSQSPGSIRGFVKDSTSGEPLAFSNALIKELNWGASADNKGIFIITAVPPGNYTILVSYVGYEPQELKAKVEANKLTQIDFYLKPNSIEMQTVEKVDERVAESNATDLGIEKIIVKDLEKLPQGVETDIFRSLQYVPGVKSAGDVSARFYVRGSPSNQNLILLNDIPVYHPFHALGMFSAVDPEMINNIEFYKGGYTADYSGALASIMKLNTKNGSINNFSGKAQASLLTGKVSLEGPLLGGSFLITGRKSYNTEILKKFTNDKNVPIDFYEMSVNIFFPEVFKTGNVKLFWFTSSDDLDNNNINEADFKWSNKLVGLKWFQLSDSPLFFEVSAYFSRFDGEVIPNLSSTKPKKNSLSDFGIDMNFRYVYDSKNELHIGLKIQEISSELILENASSTPKDISGPKGANIDVFGKYKILSNENIGIDLGTRLNLTRLAAGNSGDNFFEPRISSTIRLLPELAFKAAWGIYSQELVTLSDEDELINIFEPWFVTPSYLPTSKAIHYGACLEIQFSDELKSEVGGYYKTLLSFPALNDNKILPTDPELVEAKGKSYGLEYQLTYSPFPFRTNLSYSLTWAEKSANGITYSPRYDSRHSVNFSFEYNIGNGWYSSLTWNYYSGLPFTQISGYRDEWDIRNLERTDIIYNDLFPYTIYGKRNAVRLPDYHRLDINLSKNIDLNFMKLYLSVSVINVYDRKNIFYYEKETGKRVNMLPFLPTASVR
ncbi:MAG: TonB-dependent receptor, partial [Melioribacteraceae bacterium]